jgi:heat shock protein HtpX
MGSGGALNWLKTFGLMAVLTFLLMAVGSAIGGQQGAVLAFCFAFAINFFSYWFSDKLALRANGARPLARSEAPWLYEMVERLARRAAIPPPPLFLIPTDTPNAFATGRNPQHAAVAVTEGILRLMDRRELEGVLAHELSHVVNRDTLITTFAATLAGAVSQLAMMWRWGALFGGYGGRDDDRRGGGLGTLIAVLVAPLAALLLQLALSRRREYAADESGARLVGWRKRSKPWSMATARCPSMSRPPPLRSTSSIRSRDRASRRSSRRIRPSRSGWRGYAPWLRRSGRLPRCDEPRSRSPLGGPIVESM